MVLARLLGGVAWTCRAPGLQAAAVGHRRGGSQFGAVLVGGPLHWLMEGNSRTLGAGERE